MSPRDRDSARYGAGSGAILRWVFKQALWLILIGAGSGLLAALAVTRLLRSLLFGIAPTDFATYAELVILLAVVALLACYVPARRATKVDPLVALRNE